MADFTKHSRPWNPVGDAKIAEAFETGDQEKINRAFEERFGLKPGELSKGEPEFVGKFPVRSELEVLPAPKGPSLADLELAEHGSIALRVPASVEMEGPNTIDASMTLERDAQVLVRGKAGGFYFVPLERDSQGWFVRVREDWVRLDVTIDRTRNLWVVRNTV